MSRVRKQIKPGSRIVNGNLANGKSNRKTELGDAKMESRMKSKKGSAAIYTNAARTRSTIC